MRILPERQKETEQVAKMKENEARGSFLLNTIRDGHKYMKYINTYKIKIQNPQLKWIKIKY